MAITTIEGYTPMITGRIALGADGSINWYQPNAAGGMLVFQPAGTVPQPPALSVAPAISGTPKNGQTLTVSNGTWLNTPTSYTYMWFRNGAVIGGATSQTYVLVGADINDMIVAQVTAINASGTGIGQSAAVGPVSS